MRIFSDQWISTATLVIEDVRTVLYNRLSDEATRENSRLKTDFDQELTRQLVDPPGERYHHDTDPASRYSLTDTLTHYETQHRKD